MNELESGSLMSSDRNEEFTDTATTQDDLRGVRVYKYYGYVPRFSVILYPYLLIDLEPVVTSVSHVPSLVIVLGIPRECVWK